jgi:hypothetical protein
MAKFTADDDIYRARLTYLGPTGYTLPFHLPYAEWGLFAAICAVLVFLSWLITGGFTMVGLPVAGAMLATSYIWGHVDPDLPVRKLLATVATDLRRTPAPVEARLPRLSARRVRIGGQP